MIYGILNHVANECNFPFYEASHRNFWGRNHINSAVGLYFKNVWYNKLCRKNFLIQYVSIINIYLMKSSSIFLSIKLYLWTLNKFYLLLHSSKNLTPSMSEDIMSLEAVRGAYISRQVKIKSCESLFKDRICRT